MALSHSPRITTDGLVLCLDAANIRSYVGSGVTWTDISGRGNNGTLEVKDNVYNAYDLQVGDFVLPNSNSANYPTYDSTNLGSIGLDGNDDYVDFFAPNLSTTTTVEIWARLGTSYQEKVLFGWLYYGVWCQGGSMGYNTGNSDVYGISSATVSSLGLINNWKHYVFEMRSDASYTNNKMYVNGVLQTLSNQSSGTESATNRTFNSGNGRICAWRSNISYPMPMNCSSFKVYNRALSTTEISQNFNALRGRFGI